MILPLKSNIKVFIGIPQLSRSDKYSSYIGSVLNHIDAQETDVELMKPYITPPHAGNFHTGADDRLDAIVERMNKILDTFMTTDASHVFINDGDVEIPPNTIDTLIRHDVDMASGVYPFHNFDESYSMLFGRVTSYENPCGHIRPRDWDYMKGRILGETERWGGGTGCLLIKRRVLKRHHPRIKPLRLTRQGPDRTCGGDIYFWKRVQDRGFTARIDANIVCGHLPKYPLKDIKSWIRKPIKQDT